jgi:hypothetical protein
LEGLEWIAEDMDFDSEYNNPMKNYSLEKFMGMTWIRPAHDINSWSFEEATDRVNSPELCSIFSSMRMSYASFTNAEAPIETIFEGKKGNCVAQARLNAYFLLKNGYEKYTSNSKKSNSCCVFEVMFDKALPDGVIGHDVCLFTNKEGIIYFLNVRGGIDGPFKTEEAAAEKVAKNYGVNVTSCYCK